MTQSCSKSTIVPSHTLHYSVSPYKCKATHAEKYKYNGVQILEIWCGVFRHPSLSVSPTPHPTPPLPYTTCVGIVPSQCHATMLPTQWFQWYQWYEGRGPHYFDPPNWVLPPPWGTYLCWFKTNNFCWSHEVVSLISTTTKSAKKKNSSWEIWIAQVNIFKWVYLGEWR